MTGINVGKGKYFFEANLKKSQNNVSKKVEALRQLGNMLKETERADGGDAQRTRFQKSTESPPTLSELGIDKKISSLSQKIAGLTDEEIEKLKREWQ